MSPTPNRKPQIAIPSSIGAMRQRRRAAPDAISAKAVSLTQRLGAVEEEVRALRVRAIDIEDVATLADMFVDEVQAAIDETDGVMFWPREWVLRWASQFREARQRMINREPPDEAPEIDG